MNEIKPITLQIIDQVTRDYQKADLVNEAARRSNNMCFYAAAYSLARQIDVRLWEKQQQIAFLQQVSLRQDRGMFSLKNSLEPMQDILSTISLKITRFTATRHNYFLTSTFIKRRKGYPFGIRIIDEDSEFEIQPPAIIILVSKKDQDHSHAIPHNGTTFATDLWRELSCNFALASVIEIESLL